MMHQNKQTKKQEKKFKIKSKNTFKKFGEKNNMFCIFAELYWLNRREWMNDCVDKIVDELHVYKHIVCLCECSLCGYVRYQ